MGSDAFGIAGCLGQNVLDDLGHLLLEDDHKRNEYDQDQDDLNHAQTLFILDEEVSGRAPSVPQTVQHFLHGEVLLSAYFPMPCPGGGSEGLQVSCPAEPVILPDTEHQRKKDPPPGCRNLRKADKLLCSFRPETAGSYYYEKGEIRIKSGNKDRYM